MQATFKLQFPLSEVPKLAARYSYRYRDDDVVDAGQRARRRGYYTRPDFLILGN